jgi:hypothetical protein
MSLATRHLPMCPVATRAPGLYMLNNIHLFITNQEIHSINTRSNLNFHIPVANATKFKKGGYYSGIKLFNHLPLHVKSLSNDINLLRTSLKRFLYNNSFYAIEEYFKFQSV